MPATPTRCSALPHPAATLALADIATGYLATAFHLRQHQQLVQHTQPALNSKIVLEQAQDAIGARSLISADEVFTKIGQHARHRTIVLRESACAIGEDSLRF